MKVMSWNVQGLGGPKCKQVKGWLGNELKIVNSGCPIDMLFLQEHHMSKRRIDSYGSILPGQWLTYWSPGIGPHGAQAGVSIAVAEKWKDNIVQYNEVRPGRAQYVVLQINGMHCGFLNVYAPNQVGERVTFWTWLASELPDIENWLLGGDFC